MLNDSAAEAQTKSAPHRPALILRAIFLAPLIIAAFGIVGYLKWTAAGLAIEHTIVWLALTLTSACWAATHWVGFLNRGRG